MLPVTSHQNVKRIGSDDVGVGAIEVLRKQPAFNSGVLLQFQLMTACQIENRVLIRKICICIAYFYALLNILLQYILFSPVSQNLSSIQLSDKFIAKNTSARSQLLPTHCRSNWRSCCLRSPVFSIFYSHLHSLLTVASHIRAQLEPALSKASPIQFTK